MESRRRGLGNTEQGDTHLMFTKRSEELRKLVAQEEGKASGKATGSAGPDMYVRSLTECAEGVCTEGGRGRKEGSFPCSHVKRCGGCRGSKRLILAIAYVDVHVENHAERSLLPHSLHVHSNT